MFWSELRNAVWGVGYFAANNRANRVEGVVLSVKPTKVCLDGTNPEDDFSTPEEWESASFHFRRILQLIGYSKVVIMGRNLSEAVPDVFKSDGILSKNYNSPEVKSQIDELQECQMLPLDLNDLDDLQLKHFIMHPYRTSCDIELWFTAPLLHVEISGPEHSITFQGDPDFSIHPGQNLCGIIKAYCDKQDLVTWLFER